MKTKKGLPLQAKPQQNNKSASMVTTANTSKKVLKPKSIKKPSEAKEGDGKE